MSNSSSVSVQEEKNSRGIEVIKYDEKAEKRARLKIDLIVIPIVGMYYLLSFLDRANIGNARVAGLQKTLQMTDHQYSVALTVTYVPYIAMELPSNLLMKRFGANRTLPYMVTLWGVVCACQGAVKSYHGLLACRFFLGALEGGLFPGIVLYMSSFYKRHNLQLRISLMFSSASLAGAFSGLLAAAIQQLHARGIPGWGWIFILEGVFTTLFGIVSAFILPRNPEDTLGLTQGEKEAYRDSLRSDWSGDFEGEVFRWSEVLKAFRSPQVLLICVPLFFNGATLFGLAYFTPSIVSALGYSPNHTQLLTVPPYVCAFFVSIFTS